MSRGVLALAVLVGGLAGLAGAQPNSAGIKVERGPDGADTPEVERVETLLRALDDDSSSDHEREQLEALRALGPPGALCLLRTLELEAFADGQSTTRRQARVALEAVCSLRREAVLGTLKTWTREGADERRCEVALRVLAGSGEARDLDFAVDLISEQEGPLTPDLADSLARTTYSLLNEHPGGLGRTKLLIVHARIDVAAALVRGIGRLESPSAATLLADVLSLVPELDLPLLAEVGGCARQSILPLPPDVGEVLRTYLFSEDAQLVREAALALGKLQDFASVPLLIDIMEHEVSSVREAAHWSLCQVTGLGLRPSPASWRIWYERERTWWDEGSAVALERLAAEDHDQVLLGLGELACHRWRADRLADEVSGLLGSPDPRLRTAACRTLETLGSKAAVPALIGSLEDFDEDVSTSAHAALQSLTGLSLGNDPVAWQERAAR